jgi:hypothetical protein
MLNGESLDQFYDVSSVNWATTGLGFLLSGMLTGESLANIYVLC